MHWLHKCNFVVYKDLDVVHLNVSLKDKYETIHIDMLVRAALDKCIIASSNNSSNMFLSFYFFSLSLFMFYIEVSDLSPCREL